MLHFHDTQTNVDAAVQKVFVNLLRARAAEEDDTLYTDPENTNARIVVSIAADDDLVGCVLLGKRRRGKILRMDRRKGHVTRWDTPMSCQNSDNWYALAPSSDEGYLMDGVSCNIADFDPAWIEEGDSA